MQVDAYDLALTKVYSSDTSADGQSTDGQIVAGDNVTFTITVTNQGTVDGTNIVVTDYLPAGFTLSDSAWSDNGDGTAEIIVSSIAVGEQVEIPITLTADGASTGSSVNWAEISADDGNDLDSTPNDDPGDDNQPAAPGDATDDATDNSTGPGGADEDDHDPAAVDVVADFDLALAKVIDADVTSLPVVNGQNVTFTLTVMNQGTTPADAVSVLDTVDTALWLPFVVADNPAGTTGGDVALPYTWAATGTDGSVTLGGVLAGGEAVTIPVTLTIAEGADLSALQNAAEISASTPLNPDGSPMPGVVDPNDDDDVDTALVEPPTYSVGNQVWFDEDNNGVIDPGEEGIAGVSVVLFTDADGDGEPDDLDGDGQITAADGVASTTTDGFGFYLFDDLEPGDYVVGVPGENWDVGGPLHGTLSSDPTSNDPNNDIDSDDEGTPVDGFVLSGPVTLGDREPLGENPDNDAATPDLNENLTVDFGFWQPVYDLSLIHI